MIKQGKKILSALLAASMVCSLLPAAAGASEPAEIIIEEAEPAGTESAGESDAAQEPELSDETVSSAGSDAGAAQEPEPELSIESIEVVEDPSTLAGIPEAQENAQEAQEDIPEDEEQTIEVEIPLDVDTSVLADPEELIEGYIEQVFDTSGIAAAANYGSKHLEGSDLIAYNILREAIEEIAAGNRSSAVVSLDGISYQWTYAEMGLDRTASTDEMKAALLEMFNSELAINKILLYLLVDCPYDLYWFDKTTGLAASYNISYSPGNYAKASGIKFYFAVSTAYRSNPYNANNPSVDTEKTSVASKAAENAQAIAAKHAQEPDVQRLTSYKDEICALTSYDYDAASSTYSGGYGDPWQLIYVFDGDDSTKVVCEGYAKAFQYLCDLDGGDEVCYLVSGQMSNAAHMWNIVRLNGESYLADVTNSDTGTIGQNGELFLANADSASSTGKDNYGYPVYTFRIGSSSVTYVYDSSTTGIYPLSVLTLGTSPVEEEPIDLSACTVTLTPSVFTYDGTEKTPVVTVKHGDFELEHQTDYTYSFKNNINAGTATVTITGAGIYTGTETADFTIGKADQEVEAGVAEASIAVGGTTKVNASGIGTLTYSSSDPSVATVNSSGTVTGVSEGTAIITVTAAGNSNYNAGSTICSIAVALTEPTPEDPADLDDCTITLSSTSYTYDGKAKTPTVTVRYGSTTLVRNTDFTRVYGNNVNAGTATVTVTGTGNYTGTRIVEFTINKASQTVEASLGADTITVGETTTVTSTEIGSVTYSSDNTSVATVSSAGVVTGKSAGIARITVKAAGDANYNSATATLTIQVKAAEVQTETPQSETTGSGSGSSGNGNSGSGNSGSGSSGSGNTGTSGSSGSSSSEKLDQTLSVTPGSETLTQGDVVTLQVSGHGTITFSSSNTKVATVTKKGKIKAVAPGTATITVKAAGTSTYHAASVKVSVKVRPKPTKLTSLKSNASKKMTLHWKKVSGVTGYQIIYSTSSDFSGSYKTKKVKKAATVQKTISGLHKGTTYYVKIRTYKNTGGKTYYSAWSAKKKVKIK